MFKQNKYFSRTSFTVAALAMFFGATSETLNTAVHNTENPELIKFLAPIAAALLSKLIDKLFNRRNNNER